MTTIGDILATMEADVADLPIDMEISGWLLDYVLLEATGEVRYYSPPQGESEPEGYSAPTLEFLFITARPVVRVEDGHRVGRWRVERGIFDWFDLPTRGRKNLGYFGTLPEALEAVEAYIREGNP